MKPIRTPEPEPDAIRRPARGDAIDYPAVLFARKWTVAGVAAVVMSVGLFMSSRQPPTFVSTAEVLIKSPSEQGSQTQVNINMATEKDVADSAAVAQAVIARLRLGATPASLLKKLSVEVPVDTEIIAFHFADREATRAQRVAEGFAQSYLAYRSKELSNDLAASEQPIQDRIRVLTDSLRAIQNEGNPDSAEAKAQTSSLLTQIAIFEQKLAEISPSTGLSGGQVLQHATLPSSPALPNHLKDGMIALFVGLLLGLAAAIFRDRIDDRLRGRDEIEALLGVPVLGSIPRMRGIQDSAGGGLVTRTKDQPFAAEAFRRLAANLVSASGRFAASVVLITSSGEEEGKTLTTANLGVALAQAGKKVILVSGDLRRPRLEDLFGYSGQAGLADVLAGTCGLAEALIDTDVPNLAILPAGVASENPTELLGGSRTADLIHEMGQSADFVLVDSAPLLPVADTAVLAPACDGVLFAADARSTTRSSINEARRQLDRVNALVLGVVLIDPHLRPFGKYPYFQPSSTRKAAGVQELPIDSEEPATADTR